ncbi:MAG: molybdopterin-synthase adenylyltransferase MoeB, partial [Spirochaetota bacterium]|nr:molybdopterin-synthase adenylyltransferase MoeB [Spirochaetota bacterium]
MVSVGLDLTQEQIKRYSRHIVLPEVGLEGQERLLESRVLIIGAGGLGSPLSVYLAAAGVGTIGLVDFDVVEYSNLQRQIVHFTKDVGRPKIDSAAEKIVAINPDVTVIKHSTHISSQNAMDIIKDYEYVIDGTDNFPTRYLVNDACVMLGKTNIYGSIYRFDGQATVFKPKEGPCYRCLYPEPPPPGLIPSCQDGGVIGVLPGIIGIIQATEVIKMITGSGTPLIGRLLLYDAMEMGFNEVNIERNPSCPVCGDNPTITELIDYNQFCGVRTSTEVEALTQAYNIPVEKAHKILIENKDDVILLDVREPQEYQITHIDGSVLIPMALLPDEVQNLDMSKQILVICRVGERSLEAAQFLTSLGFKAKNI